MDKKHISILLLVATISLFTNLGRPRLWDRDEPRNAGCAMEMMQRGDWIVPVFNAELRTHKPVLTYWLMMSAYAVFGVGEFAARFWSALLAVGTVLLTYQMGCRLFRPQTALYGALALATSLMFNVAGHAATPDSPLIFFSTLALAIYVSNAFPDNADYFPRSWARAAAMYAAMGIAVLVKGPIGLVLPTAVIGMFLLIMRLPKLSATTRKPSWWIHLCRLVRPFAPLHFLRTCWFMRPVTAIAVVCLIAAPWYAWVGIRTDGAFLRGFFWEHNVGRATGVMEGHNGPFLVFYAVAILAGFFPWSIFAIPTVLETVHRIRDRHSLFPSYVFAACWIGVYVVLFSMASTKLPSYVTPCYPAVALLTGSFIDRWVAGSSTVRQVWTKLALTVLMLVGLVAMVGLWIALPQLLPGEQVLALLGALLLAGGTGCLLLVLRQQRRLAAHGFALVALTSMTFVFGVAMVRVDGHRESDQLLTAIRQHSSAPRVAAYDCLEPSLIFYARQPIDVLTLDEVAPQLSPEERKIRRPERTPDEFFADGEDRFIITTEEHWPVIQKRLPATADVLAKCEFFLRNQRLLLIGIRPELASTLVPSHH